MIHGTLPGTEDTVSAPKAGARARLKQEPCLLRVLWADSPLSLPTRHSLVRVEEAIIGRGERQVTRIGSELALHCPDRKMSTQHARLTRNGDRWVLVDSRSRNGTFVNGCRIDKTSLADGDVIETGHTFWVFRTAVPGGGGEPLDRDGSLIGDYGVQGMATMSAEMAEHLRMVISAAPSDQPIFFTGETGTGKEVMAEATHRLSGRLGSLIPVNCGAIPEPLLEATLFGHAKGAFTGANQGEIGAVRAADQGTLFLDEIGDLPLASQPRFLRVLEQCVVTPVGSTKSIPVDIRLIAATHMDLEKQVEIGRFRQDLWARLAGFIIRLPPLRERREDIGLLTAGFLASRANGDKVSFSRDAARSLLAHSWPLNIRELKRAIGVAITPCGASGEIEFRHLPEGVRCVASVDSGRSELARDPLRQFLRPTATECMRLPENLEDWLALSERFPDARSMKDLARLAGLPESTLRARRDKHAWPDLFSRSPRRRR